MIDNYPPQITPDIRSLALADSHLALGIEVATDQSAKGMERQGRPLTNREMSAVLFLNATLKRICIDQGQCCGVPDGATSDGFCFGTTAKCPLKLEMGKAGAALCQK